MGLMIVSWLCRIAVGVMFLMTGVMKLMMQEEPKALFEQLGGTPMMLLTGVMEVAAAVLILVPKTKALGAVLAMGVMGGAIVSHLTVLGTGGMFPMAVVLFIAAGIVAFLYRAQLPVVGKALAGIPAKGTHAP